MHGKKTVDLLATYIDQITNDATPHPDLAVPVDADLAEIAPLGQLAFQVRQSMPPAEVRAEFKTKLKKDLLARANRLAEEKGIELNQVPLFHRRWVIIGAAAGSVVLSVAGIVAAVLLRQRSVAHS